MPEEDKKSVLFFNRIKNKYRLVVMNDDTFEEKVSLKLSPLGLFTTTGLVIIVLIVVVTSLIAFTPLREYIPGYADLSVRRRLISLSIKADSIEQESLYKGQFIKNFKNIINGNTSESAEKTKVDSTKKYVNLNLKPSKEDSLLRLQIESQDQYSLATNEDNGVKNSISSFFFFTPLKGLVSSSFKNSEGHYGVDVVAAENEAIKTVLDGTVIISTWTLETGYIIEVQHNNNLISIYKHNSALLKKAGQYVKAGEAIAIIGNSGELTSGPHLHFELWYNGSPIDPQDYMIF